jgi:hypothetical protein
MSKPKKTETAISISEGTIAAMVQAFTVSQETSRRREELRHAASVEATLQTLQFLGNCVAQVGLLVNAAISVEEGRLALDREKFELLKDVEEEDAEEEAKIDVHSTPGPEWDVILDKKDERTSQTLT